MSGGTPDEEYLSWLYRQVADARGRRSSYSYRVLFKELFSMEFYWTVPNDENRAADGLALRDEWMSQTGCSPDPSWLSLGCSFLEMLIALTRRMAFDAGNTPDYWFRDILGNLNLNADMTPEEIHVRVGRVLQREYDKKGRGGLFPLQRPRRDQRRVEIWYQFHTYLLETQ